MTCINLFGELLLPFPWLPFRFVVILFVRIFFLMGGNSLCCWSSFDFPICTSGLIV